MKHIIVASLIALVLTFPQAAGVQDAHAGGLPMAVEEHEDSPPSSSAPILQQAYLKASNTGVRDHFGWSVAIDGDTAVVGAPDEDSRATNSGAAYVFARKDGVWIQEAFLVGTGGDME